MMSERSYIKGSRCDRILKFRLKICLFGLRTFWKITSYVRIKNFYMIFLLGYINVTGIRLWIYFITCLLSSFIFSYFLRILLWLLLLNNKGWLNLFSRSLKCFGNEAKLSFLNDKLELEALRVLFLLRTSE